jgi:D-threo-aldose 1-dehydrogenase
MSGKAILLHPDDNVLVCIAPVTAGEPVDIDGQETATKQDIAVGHKLARRALNGGDKVVKYGAPIGSMTAAAQAGEWVHTHNMKSDYIASHTRTTVIVEGDGA